jgi:hypothetical protein
MNARAMTLSVRKRLPDFLNYLKRCADAQALTAQRESKRSIRTVVTAQDQCHAILLVKVAYATQDRHLLAACDFAEA